MRMNDANGIQRYAIDKLRKAADLIEREGWVQGTYKSWDGHYCLVGAVNSEAVACRRALCYYDAIHSTNVALTAVGKVLMEKGYSADPVHFNDSLATGKSEVLQVMREAADRLEGAAGEPEIDATLLDEEVLATIEAKKAVLPADHEIIEAAEEVLVEVEVEEERVAIPA